jgi:hypothetical protein
MIIPKCKEERDGDHIYLRQFTFDHDGPEVTCIGHSPAPKVNGQLWGQVYPVVQKYRISKLNLLNIFSLSSPAAKSIKVNSTNWKLWYDENNEMLLRNNCENADYLICCWNGDRLFKRPAEVCKKLINYRDKAKCFDVSVNNRPYHYRGWDMTNLPKSLDEWKPFDMQTEANKE